MTRLSLGDVWIETRAFLQREGALVFPLGLATLGIAMLVTGLIVPEPVNGQVRAGAWMAGMIPLVILLLIGNLGISALVLIPAITVRDAIRIAFGRLGAAIALVLLLVAVTVFLIMLLSIIAVVIGAGLGWNMAQSASLAVFLTGLPLIWLSVRLMPVWAHIVSSRDGPMAAGRASLALTRGHFWRLGAAFLLFLMLYLLFSSAAQFALGSIFLLLGRLFGEPELGRVLTAVVVALLGAALSTGWTVFIALLYRRLAAR